MTNDVTLTNAENPDQHSLGFGGRKSPLSAQFDEFFFRSEFANRMYSDWRMFMFDRPAYGARVVTLTGYPGVGKSHLIRRWTRMFSPIATHTTDIQHVIATTPAADCSVQSFVSSFLVDVSHPVRMASTNNKEAENHILNVLERAETGMLIFNRADNLALGERRIKGKLTPLITRLLDHAKLTIVFVGTPNFPSSLDNVVNYQSSATVNYFLKPLDFTVNETGDWSRLFKELSDSCDCNVDVCFHDGVTESLYQATEGKPPAVMRLMRLALNIAVRNHESSANLTELSMCDIELSLPDLEQAFRLFKPSEVNPFRSNWKERLVEAEVLNLCLLSQDEQRGRMVNV